MIAVVATRLKDKLFLPSRPLFTVTCIRGEIPALSARTGRLARVCPILRIVVPTPRVDAEVLRSEPI